MKRVAQILLAPFPESAMQQQEVRAIPGKGLVGDQCFCGAGTVSPHPQKPDFEVTFIGREKIEAFARDPRLPFTSLHA